MSNEQALEIRKTQTAIHKNAVEHGWWEPQKYKTRTQQEFEENGQDTLFLQRSFGDLIALIHSELSEALEAYRDHGLDNWEEWPTNQNLPTWSGGDAESAECYLIEYAAKAKELGIVPKPEGAFVELADAIIRILDMSEFYGVDMQELILEKMKYNEGREYRHGNKTL